MAIWRVRKVELMQAELRTILRFSGHVKMVPNLAGQAGKTLRMAFRTLLLNSADNRMVSRLTQAMVKVIQADLVNERGLRNVIDGEAELLAGFEFNIGGKLGTSLFAPFVGAIDRVTGEITVDLASFIPANMIAAPSGTTHFKIISAGAEILQNESYRTVVSFELMTSEKLVIPASCTISRIYKSTDVVICLFSTIVDNTMEKWTTAGKIFTAEEQKSHNYLDVKSTQEVYDYILANMDSTMPTLKELSHLFGTNEYKLKNSFRHLFKMTIHQFYNSERLNRSQLLIKYTKIPLKNIAIMAGFTNYPNFSRAFKIKFGCSPTDIEKQSTIK
jgi:AraC-like DNA-binding protein